MSNPADIRVEDVCFAYGDREVLHNVAFEIPRGAFVAVVGPNGGGKTTLMRLVLGELQPLYGQIRLLGGSVPANRPRVGYVPQQMAFDSAFPVTVSDVVVMGTAGARWGGYRAAERARAAAALGRVGLDGFGPRPFHALSGGQRQRVLIAQALVGDPEMLVLDEPTANVDEKSEADIYALLTGWNREGRTVVVVSHNLSVVTAQATHVLCVNRAAALHRMEELTDGWIEAPGGGRFVLIHHREECQVNHVGEAHTPHRGEHGHG